jgi:hypothetical protein
MVMALMGRAGAEKGREPELTTGTKQNTHFLNDNDGEEDGDDDDVFS